MAQNCYGKRNNLATKEKDSRQKKKPRGKKNNLKAKVKDSYNGVYYSFCAIELIDKYDFRMEIIDSFNYSYYNWKPKLVLVLI